MYNHVYQCYIELKNCRSTCQYFIPLQSNKNCHYRRLFQKSPWDLLLLILLEKEGKWTKYSFQDNTEWWQEEVPCPLDSSCYPQISKKESSFITLFEYGDDQALITLTALDHATIQELPNLFAPAFSAFTPFSLVAGGSYLWRNPDKNLVFVLDLLEELQGWTMYCHGLVLKVLIEYNQFCLVLLAPSWVIDCILVDIAWILSYMTINMQKLKWDRWKNKIVERSNCCKVSRFWLCLSCCWWA